MVNLQLTFWYAEAVGCDMETRKLQRGQGFQLQDLEEAKVEG